MHSEKINEIVAHFVGLFDTAIDDARMGIQYLQGTDTPKTTQNEPVSHAETPDFRSEFAPKNYDPGISYELGAYENTRLDAADHRPLSLHRPDDPAAAAQAERVDDPLRGYSDRRYQWRLHRMCFCSLAA